MNQKAVNQKPVSQKAVSRQVLESLPSASPAEQGVRGAEPPPARCFPPPRGLAAGFLRAFLRGASGGSSALSAPGGELISVEPFLSLCKAAANVLGFRHDLV